MTPTANTSGKRLKLGKLSLRDLPVALSNTDDDSYTTANHYCKPGHQHGFYKLIHNRCTMEGTSISKLQEYILNCLCGQIMQQAGTSIFPQFKGFSSGAFNQVEL